MVLIDKITQFIKIFIGKPGEIIEINESLKIQKNLLEYI